MWHARPTTRSLDEYIFYRDRQNAYYHHRANSRSSIFHKFVTSILYFKAERSRLVPWLHSRRVLYLYCFPRFSFSLFLSLDFLPFSSVSPPMNRLCHQLLPYHSPLQPFMPIAVTCISNKQKMLPGL